MLSLGLARTRVGGSIKEKQGFGRKAWGNDSLYREILIVIGG